MEYTLKDKLVVTKAFIDELTDKSWQEIEHLQNQIVNLDKTEDGTKVERLLKNLLTSYYVFVGGLENIDNIDSGTSEFKIEEPTVEEEPKSENVPVISQNDDIPLWDSMHDSMVDSQLTDTEPFEYFVDFDEPIGDPLTDDDLYNN
jgi:hypothetical protein